MKINITQKEIIEYNKRCAEFLGNKIDFNVADWSKHDDKSLTEHWNNDNKTWVHTPKGKGLPWYRVKHRELYYQLFTDFTFSKLKESELELGGNYNDKYYLLNDMKFHSDWNWIMEVVEAIENKLKFVIKIVSSPTFSSKWLKHRITIQENKWDALSDNKYIVDYNSDYTNKQSKKEAVVEAINQFLILYNENKII